jgi:ribokinase
VARGTVVVVGSVNADLVVAVERLPAPGETVTGGSFEHHGGGKGANQAVAAARAGADVRLVGAVGDDDLGADALRELEGEGIDVSAVARLADAPTGVALIVRDDEGENAIAVASGANARVDAALVERALAERPLPAGAAVCLLSFELPDEALAAAARATDGAGLVVVANPAPARRLADDLVAAGPILTPNRGEAAELSGEGDPEAAARALGARTGAPVLVTLGAEGVLLVDGGVATRVPAPEVDAVDATGAGDAFSGVLAAALAAGRDLDAAARCAVAAASRSVTARGARGGMPVAAKLDDGDPGRRAGLR